MVCGVCDSPATVLFDGQPACDVCAMRLYDITVPYGESRQDLTERLLQAGARIGAEGKRGIALDGEVVSGDRVIVPVQLLGESGPRWIDASLVTVIAPKASYKDGGHVPD